MFKSYYDEIFRLFELVVFLFFYNLRHESHGQFGATCLKSEEGFGDE